MVSEDSDDLVPGFTPIHRLHDLDHLRRPLAGLVLTAGHLARRKKRTSRSRAA